MRSSLKNICIPFNEYSKHAPVVLSKDKNKSANASKHAHDKIQRALFFRRGCLANQKVHHILKVFDHIHVACELPLIRI